MFVSALVTVSSDFKTRLQLDTELECSSIDNYYVIIVILTEGVRRMKRAKEKISLL